MPDWFDLKWLWAAALVPMLKWGWPPTRKLLSPPNIEFGEIMGGKPLSHFPEHRFWRRVPIINRGRRFGLAASTAEDCHGVLILERPGGVTSAHTLAFVEDYPADWAVNPKGKNPCESINIPPNDSRVWVSLWVHIMYPVVMEHDKHRLIDPPEMAEGYYLASWAFIQNLGDRRPLLEDAYSVRIVLESNGRRWESETYQLDVI